MAKLSHSSVLADEGSSKKLTKTHSKGRNGDIL